MDVKKLRNTKRQSANQIDFVFFNGFVFINVESHRSLAMGFFDYMPFCYRQTSPLVVSVYDFGFGLSIPNNFSYPFFVGFSELVRFSL
jgi:hypothetical protein